MAKFQKCGNEVRDMAQDLIEGYDGHQSLIDREVKIDFLFAYGDVDETTGEVISDALKRNGLKVHGLARKISLKDRAKGMGDAEICLDGDHWDKCSEAEQRAILDHELYHIVATEKSDDLGRPIVKLRNHDFEVGWFANIAARHSVASVERRQARAVMDQFGQYFWPGFEEKQSRFANVELKAMATK